MSRHRFFVASSLPETSDAVAIPLSEADTHHALNVLRVQPGEEIVVVEPHGRARIVQVVSVATGGLTGTLVGELAPPSEPHITLVQGIAKGSAMDQIVQHAVELGAERIVPVLTERTVVRLEPGKAAARAARWQRIAEGAARQSQRSRVPLVATPATLAEVTPLFAEHDLAVVLWEESDSDSLAAVLTREGINETRPHARVALVVGPEGGLSAGEVGALTAAGAVVASLGGAVLRAETAALVAMTLVAQSLGALGTPSCGAESGAARSPSRATPDTGAA